MQSRPGRRRRSRRAWTWAALAAALLPVAALALIYSGVYDVSAVRQHTAPVYWALEEAMRSAVRRRAGAIEPPPLGAEEQLRRGFILHREACVQCHGAPGVAPGAAAMGLLPVPNNLAQTAAEWSAAEIFWVTKNGLKMTGMPAWGMRYGDEDLWAIVAFVNSMPGLTAAAYFALGRDAAVAAPARPTPASGGDPARGKLALQQHTCTACHRIPGMVGPAIYVGPPLDGVASRTYIAGRLPNSPENLALWIRDPRSISAHTLMPDLRVSEQHARDMAAYLQAAGAGGR